MAKVVDISNKVVAKPVQPVQPAQSTQPKSKASEILARNTVTVTQPVQSNKPNEANIVTDYETGKHYDVSNPSKPVEVYYEIVKQPETENKPSMRPLADGEVITPKSNSVKINAFGKDYTIPVSAKTESIVNGIADIVNKIPIFGNNLLELTGTRKAVVVGGQIVEVDRGDGTFVPVPQQNIIPTSKGEAVARFKDAANYLPLVWAINYKDMSTSEKVINGAFDALAIATMGIGGNIKNVVSPNKLMVTATRVGDATKEMKQALKVLNNTPVTSPKYAEVSDYARKAITEAKNTHNTFVNELSNIGKVSPVELEMIERESGVKGLKNAMLEVSDAQNKLTQAWKNVDNQKFGTVEYTKSLNEAQLAKSKLDETLELFNQKVKSKDASYIPPEVSRSATAIKKDMFGELIETKPGDLTKRIVEVPKMQGDKIVGTSKVQRYGYEGEDINKLVDLQKLPTQYKAPSTKKIEWDKPIEKVTNISVVLPKTDTYIPPGKVYKVKEFNGQRYLVEDTSILTPKAGSMRAFGDDTIKVNKPLGRYQGIKEDLLTGGSNPISIRKPDDQFLGGVKTPYSIEEAKGVIRGGRGGSNVPTDKIVSPGGTSISTTSMIDQSVDLISSKSIPKVKGYNISLLPISVSGAMHVVNPKGVVATNGGYGVMKLTSDEAKYVLDNEKEYYVQPIGDVSDNTSIMIVGETSNDTTTEFIIKSMLSTILQNSIQTANILSSENKTINEIQNQVRYNVQSQIKQITNTRLQQVIKAQAKVITKVAMDAALRTKIKYGYKFTPKIKMADGSYRYLTKDETYGAVAWKQGFMYKMIYPPYGQDNVANSLQPFDGVVLEKDASSAYEDIVKLGGRLPPNLKHNMGIVTIYVESPIGGKPRASYARRNKKRKTTRSGSSSRTFLSSFRR